MIDPLEALVIIAAGIAAGTINTIVGSGSLITFPTLLLLGYPPLVANVSNTVGLVPGTISGTIGYRRELVGQRARARPLAIAAGLGGLTGAVLLLVLPAARLRPDRARADPVACGLVAVQPRLSTWVVERRARRACAARRWRSAARPRRLPDRHLRRLLRGGPGGDPDRPAGDPRRRRPAATERAQERHRGRDQQRRGDHLHLVAPVAWGPAILLAIGSTIGGQLGAYVGRRLSRSRSGA